MIRGVIEAVIGAVIILCGWLITKWVLLIFGALLIVKGVIDLVALIKSETKGAALVPTIVTIVVGAVLCIAPFAIGDIICIIVGVLFIINGVLTLFGKNTAM